MLKRTKQIYLLFLLLGVVAVSFFIMFTSRLPTEVIDSPVEVCDGDGDCSTVCSTCGNLHPNTHLFRYGTCYDCGKVCEGDGNCARVCSLCKQKHINQHVGGALTCEPCIGCGHTSPSNHKGNPDCMNECTYCGEKDYSKHVVN